MNVKIIFNDGECAGDITNLHVAQAMYDICRQFPYVDAEVVAQMLNCQAVYDKTQAC